MNGKLFGIVRIWWLLLAPVVLGGWAAIEVARSHCLMEAGMVSQSFMCGFLPSLDPPASTGPGGTSPSVSDVAAVRISAISAYATILIGLLATLIALDALIEKARTSNGRTLTIDCNVFVVGAGRELRAALMNPGGRPVFARNLEVSSGTSQIMTHPDVTICSRSRHEWTVLTAHTPIPSQVVVRGDFNRADGSEWRFQADFDVTSGHPKASRFEQWKR